MSRTAGPQSHSWDLNSGLLTEFTVVFNGTYPSPTKSSSSHLERILI